MSRAAPALCNAQKAHCRAGKDTPNVKGMARVKAPDWNTAPAPHSPRARKATQPKALEEKRSGGARPAADRAAPPPALPLLRSHIDMAGSSAAETDIPNRLTGSA